MFLIAMSAPQCTAMHSLPKHALLTLVHALVVSKAVLAGISGSLQHRLQLVLNAAAQLVCSARKSERITPLLRDLLAASSRAHPVPVVSWLIPVCTAQRQLT